MAVYTNDLRLKEIATGDESGTWGTSTNTNLSLVAEAFSFGTEAITTNADTHTTTIADGSTDPGRSLFLKYTGTLDSTCTITIGPNTVSKLWLIENATSGSQSIIIKQGSGATITVPNGQTKAIYSDGAGSGGAMVDAFQDLSIPDLFIDDDLTFTSDSAVITFGADGDTTLTHTDGSGLTLNSTNKIMFNDASQFIQGSSATVLSLGATDEIDLTATAIDVNGTMDVSGNATLGGTLGVTGAVTANAGISIDNITIDGNEIDVSSGDLTLDIAADLIVDAESDIFFDAASGIHSFNQAGSTGFTFTNSSGDITLKTATSDKDFIVQGVDGGSTITALTLDMSAAGAATFNSTVTATSLDISGDIDVDGTTNLDVVDIDGAVDMASTLTVGGNVTINSTTLKLSGDFPQLLFEDTAGSDVDAYIVNNASGLFIGKTNSPSASNDIVSIDLSTGGVVFNEASNDADFRVESNGNTHMLFVDAGNNRVGIGASSPSTELEVSGDITAISSGPSIFLTDTDNNPDYQIKNGNGTLRIIDATNSHDRVNCSSTETILNESSADLDFRVESNGNTHMLFVDGGNDHVNIGTSTDLGGELNVSGSVVITRADNLNQLTLVCTDDDANAGPGLVLERTSSSPADGDVLGRISFNGRNDAAEDHNYARIAASISDASNATEDGILEFSTSVATTEAVSRLLLGATSSVFNEDSKDLDFRVESNGNTHMLFVDAGNDRVGIGNSSPDGTLHVKDTVAQVYIQSNDGQAAQIVFGDVSDASRGRINYDSSDNMIFETNNLQERMRIDSSGDLLVNTTEAWTGETTPHIETRGDVAGDYTGVIISNTNDAASDSASLNFGLARDGGLVFGNAGKITVGKEQDWTTTPSSVDAFMSFSTYENENSVERMRIDSAGSFSLSQGTGNNFRVIRDGDNTIEVGNYNATDGYRSTNYLSSTHTFFVASAGAGSGSRAVDIDTSGNVLVGCTDVPSASVPGFAVRDLSNGWIHTSYDSTNARTHHNFFNPNGSVGTIQTSGSSTLYNTSSDQRLKENIVDAPSASDDIDAIQVRSFDWKADGAHQKYGMVAQELQSVAPEAVSGDADSDEMMGVDYSKLVPMLVKEIQSLRARVQQLENN